MHIVSYRGPHEAGGVSRLIQSSMSGAGNTFWWHLNRNYLQARNNDLSPLMARISANVVQGHYRYANEFLWPLMHERADLLRYNKADHHAYQQLNLALAVHLFDSCTESSNQIFINDYQFASLPSYLSNRATFNQTLFWHIPWPNTCPYAAENQMIEIAKDLLCNDRIGFHTQDYVDNFCNFVQEFLPERKVNFDNSVVLSRKKSTEIITCPAGIDFNHWQQLARSGKKPAVSFPYILSVDRADYSKGVAERIEGIRQFFLTNPDKRGKIQFVFICQQTRKGLLAFDEYWHKCRELYRALQVEFATADWVPILWIEEPQSPQDLAHWYINAKALLVNPNLDGLNLTAKEFAAVNSSGTLILSEGAGVSHELKEHVVLLRNNNPESIAFAVLAALNMNSEKRRRNQIAMKKIVQKNSLDAWWNRMTVTSRTESIKTSASA